MLAMNDPIYLQQERTPNEPKVHPLIRKSFVFVPTVGMRLAPEVLVLELMRELFFEDFSDSMGAKSLNPDEMAANGGYRISDNKRAVLYALRGRRKKTKASATQDFFAPAYPVLAESSWLRRKDARVVNNLLLSGPIAQYLWHKGPEVESKKREQSELARKVTNALLGKNSCFEDVLEGREILAVAVGKEGFSNSFNLSSELPLEKFKEKTQWTDSIMKIDDDMLSRSISGDLVAVCELEGELPRMQWLHVLMTFLRFALPMWLLAQMRISDLIYKWLLDAADNERVLPFPRVLELIAERNRGLLHPTLSPTRELYERIESYMKRRVELSILLYCLEQVRPDFISGKKLSLCEGDKETLGIEKLLYFANKSAIDLRKSDRFKRVANGHNIATFLVREGEQFPAWRNPLMRGQGKNIDEFFRVLYRAEVGDEAGGYLLSSEGRGVSRGFRVFPGQLLLKTVTYLAAKKKQSTQDQGNTGKLVLQDVEDLFAQYGVDFSSAADARPLIMRELQTMGLLTGSPDAGSSVAVACPY